LAEEHSHQNRDEGLHAEGDGGVGVWVLVFSGTILAVGLAMSLLKCYLGWKSTTPWQGVY
jgi:hypothetical protein